MLVDGGRGEDGVLADVCVAVLEAGARRGKEGFYELRLAELAEEAEGVSTDVLVGVLEVIPDAVATGVSDTRSSWRPREEARCTHHTRIISCLSFPFESTLGHIS